MSPPILRRATAQRSSSVLLYDAKLFHAHQNIVLMRNSFWSIIPISSYFRRAKPWRIACAPNARIGPVGENSPVTLMETLVPLELRAISGRVSMALFGFGVASMDASNSASPLSSAGPRLAASRQEVRCAVRFPLALPVMLSSDKGEIAAVTRNVSASG